MAVFLFIFLLLLVGYAVLIEYYRKSWNSIPVFESTSFPGSFLSVIIPVRNEASNIAELLHSLSAQTFPVDSFEIIIVDDHSDDDTWTILQRLSVSFHNLRYIKSTNDASLPSSKKIAISSGIAIARGELIVTTDADCRFHPDWLATIESLYQQQRTAFIAAPVMIKPGKSFLSFFQALDFLTLQGITGASVYKRFHSMCNGANLAYAKSAFTEVNGFDGIDHIPSGDDMLLMHKIYLKHPDQVVYLKSKSAIVETVAAQSWKDFFQQRIRWASKSVHYDDKRIFWVLLLVYLMNLSFLVLAIASFFNGTYLFFFLILLLAKIIIEFPFVNSVALFFGQQQLMRYFPFFQPIHILYTIIAGWLGRFGSYEWKGRKIKPERS